MNDIDREKAIRAIITASVQSFADGFEARHIGEKDNPNGTINMKIHNVFISVLGEELQYYTALVRSFDSSLGNMLESMAINIARLFYTVEKQVLGVLYPEQTSKIAELLEGYTNNSNPLKPQIEHYNQLRKIKGLRGSTKRHVSDYYIFDKNSNIHYLIELKIGGDLDNKKARSEKEALMEQYCILSNSIDEEAKIKCFFATAYNRFGENKAWKQERVLQFFSKEELMIGRDFWNFVCNDSNGYKIVIDEYKKSAIFIKNALETIKKSYLGD